LDVLGASDFSTAAVERIVTLRPDALILDVCAPDSFDFAKTVGIYLPTAKIVAFGVSEVDDRVLACAEAGIAGYVSPDGSKDDLVAAVESALRGELNCSPRVASLLFRRLAALSLLAGPSQSTPLTRREHQIVGLVSEGMSNKEIARTLRIEDSTVKNHVHSILKKLEVHRRGEAAAWLRTAQREGLSTARLLALKTNFNHLGGRLGR
jgi:DNA-binding NarL/FixJ family response regulator